MAEIFVGGRGPAGRAKYPVFGRFLRKAAAVLLNICSKWIVGARLRGELLKLYFGVMLILGCCVSASAQAPSDRRELFSSSVADSFFRAAHELANAEQLDPSQIEQGITLLVAANRLDGTARHVLPEIIKLAARHPHRDYSQLMQQLLVNYLHASADLEVARQAVVYLLGRLSSREQREQFLEETLNALGGRNKALDSELATELGLLKAEKADHEAAQYWFVQAYSNNKYNRLAFAKLTELVGDQIKPAIYLEHLRLALGENPLDMESALAFAQYAEKLQLYDAAVAAYQYCAELFDYLQPAQELPRSIYLPWSLSSYNTERSRHKCLQIASRLRQSTQFDLLAETIAGRAAMKMADQQQAHQILKAAEIKALELVAGQPDATDSQPQAVTYEQLAWFYCFGAPDANLAVEWANKAYSTEPNSATAASILAYALVMNRQTDWAKLIIDNYQPNQIAKVALGQIQLEAGQRSLGIETLKSAVARDPGSLAAERAKEILAQQGAEYVPAIDPDVVLVTLRGQFADTLVPTFIGPEKMIAVQLQLRGDKFSYTTKLDGNVVITNNSAQPIIISEQGLFTGVIRIDAAVSGDLDRKIPNLIVTKIRPPSPIGRGANVSVPVQLCTGELRQVLLSHPQASLTIEFTIFLDPVIAEGGEPTNRLYGLAPAKVIAERPAVELSSRYLQNRLDSLAKGAQGQKVKTARLFAGLLREQQTLAGRKPLYEYAYADWMPPLLKSALLSNLADDDWVVRVQTMAAMLDLSLQYDLTTVLAENLSAAHWPVRLMAVFLLAKAQTGNFTRVLDWTAKYDTDIHVRQMAVALGGKEPPEKQQPLPTSEPAPPGTTPSQTLK
ncbi:MAG: hypothetical protein ACYS29_08890 [Planctomycetota bacterium]